jgi:hypothetical protein
VIRQGPLAVGGDLDRPAAADPHDPARVERVPADRGADLAGSAGAALCRHAFDAGWIVRIGTGRAVKVTPAGEAALRDQLGVLIGPAAPDAPAAAPAVPAGARRR